METILGLTAVLVAAIVLVLAIGRLRRGARGPEAATPPAADERLVITLDVSDVDRASSAVERLVHEAGTRALLSLPDVREVEVRSRAGAVLGVVRRTRPSPPAVAVPPALREPHRRRAIAPDPGRYTEDQPPPPQRPGISAEPEPKPPARPVADRFDLPDPVLYLLRDPSDPIDLIRAILEAGGVDVTVEGEVLRTRDLAVAVVQGSGGGFVPHEALNQAYLRIRESGLPRGLVLALGLLDPGEVRRREILAADIRHAGPDGIQRMADAVALDDDPLRFVAGPPVLEPALV